MNKIIPSFRHFNPGPSTAIRREHSGVTNSLLLWRYQILVPDSDIVTVWNHIFLITCILALFVDPLYFFLPYVGGPGCVQNDKNIGIIITILRSIADCFYVLHIFIKFRTAFVAPSSRVFGKGELVMDPREIARRYLKSDFIIDLAAALPLPQIVIWAVIPATRNGRADHDNNTFALMVLLQYVPRAFLIYPLNRRIIKTTGVVAKSAWAGAIYNLLLYVLSSHVLGAVWYLCSMTRQFSCWKAECANENAANVLACLPSFLDCDSLGQPERQYWENVTSVIANCDATNETLPFKFGMFGDAFSKGVASETFVAKYLYCLWWGLRNLSSYGQTLDTSVYIWENIFCILICLLGLILFCMLIGDMQTSLQSMMVRMEEWRVKRRDTEEWMRHRQLPDDLQERVCRFVQYKWLATRGVDEESILQSLPLDLRRQIQRHLCLALVRRVPFFAQMDDQLLDAICERLVSSLSTPRSLLFQEGDPVDEILFIIRGNLESSTTNGGKTGFFNSIILRPGDFCGEELLTWALMPNSSLNLPSSTRTVRALTQVEAFALKAEDLKFVAHQFKRLQSKKLQHAFRYYSHQWRTWGACFIQTAWRRYKKRMLAKELFEQEGNYYYISDQYEADGNYEDGSREWTSTDKSNNALHLGATILASKFAKNTRKTPNSQIASSSDSLKMPQLFKPDEPDYSGFQEEV